MESMQAQVKRMEARLDDWGKKLREVAAGADASGSSATESYRRGIAGLEAKYAAAHAELQNARRAGSKAWSSFKAKLDTACNELESTLDDLG